jgi:hypothetical protein
MARTKSNSKNTNLKKLAGHPGLYTFVNVTRDPKRENALWAKIVRDAKKIDSGSLLGR